MQLFDPPTHTLRGPWPLDSHSRAVEAPGLSVICAPIRSGMAMAAAQRVLGV